MRRTCASARQRFDPAQFAADNWVQSPYVTALAVDTGAAICGPAGVGDGFSAFGVWFGGLVRIIEPALGAPTA